jgi:excisionase family DNA binding protein
MPELSPATTPWLTTKEAATYAKTSARTIYAAVRERKLRAARINARRDLRHRTPWLDEWLEATAPREIPR